MSGKNILIIWIIMGGKNLIKVEAKKYGWKEDEGIVNEAGKGEKKVWWGFLLKKQIVCLFK